MRSPASRRFGRVALAFSLCVAISQGLCAAATLTYHVSGEDNGWSSVFASVGLFPAAAGDIEVIGNKAPTTTTDWNAKVNRGTILVLEGESAVAASFGFQTAKS